MKKQKCSTQLTDSERKEEADAEEERFAFLVVSCWLKCVYCRGLLAIVNHNCPFS
jgi:hypothetical protein